MHTVLVALEEAFEEALEVDVRAAVEILDAVQSEAQNLNGSEDRLAQTE